MRRVPGRRRPRTLSRRTDKGSGLPRVKRLPRHAARHRWTVSQVRGRGVRALRVDPCAISDGRAIADNVALRGNGSAIAWTTAEGILRPARACPPRGCVAKGAASPGRSEAPRSRCPKRLPGEAGACGGCPLGLEALVRQRAELSCGGALLGERRLIQRGHLDMVTVQLLEWRHGPGQAVAAWPAGQSRLPRQRAGRSGQEPVPAGQEVGTQPAVPARIEAVGPAVVAKQRVQ
jgi:hypothetical protein